MPRRLLAVAMETACGSQPKMPQPPLSLLSQPLPPGAPPGAGGGLGTSGRGEGLGLACAAPPRGHTWQRTALASQSQKDGGRSAACQGLWALGTITPAYQGGTSERLGVQPRTRGAGTLPDIGDAHCHALSSAPHSGSVTVPAQAQEGRPRGVLLPTQGYRTGHPTRTARASDPKLPQDMAGDPCTDATYSPPAGLPDPCHPHLCWEKVAPRGC